MIIQGSNEAIYFDAGIDLADCKSLEVSLYSKTRGELKHWTKDAVEITESQCLCPLTQEETDTFPHGEAILEVKAVLKDAETTTHFEPERVRIRYRFDKTVMEVT